MIFEFKNKNLNNTDIIMPIWKGQSTLAPSLSTVYLQIYNRTTELWETIDSDNATAANTTFTLTSTVDSGLVNYYDGEYWVSFRIYQDA